MQQRTVMCHKIHWNSTRQKGSALSATDLVGQSSRFLVKSNLWSNHIIYKIIIFSSIRCFQFKQDTVKGIYCSTKNKTISILPELLPLTFIKVKHFPFRINHTRGSQTINSLRENSDANHDRGGGNDQIVSKNVTYILIYHRKIK